MQPDQPKVAHMYYNSPMADVNFGLTCLFAFVLGLALIVITFTNNDLAGILFAWSIEGVVIASIFARVSEVETKPEGLKIRYFLRKSRLIAWDDINEVAVRQGQGAWLILWHKPRLLGVISFQVDYGLNNEKQKIDRLLGIIADRLYPDRQPDLPTREASRIMIASRPITHQRHYERRQHPPRTA